MRILLTAIGKRVQLIKHLKKCNYLVGVDSGELAPGSFFVDAFFCVPPYHEEGYIETLVGICIKENIDMLIPLYEKEFMLLDENRESFEEYGTLLLLSHRAILELCNDKWNTYTFFKDNGINTPISYLKEQLVEADRIPMDYPIIIKPRDGMGSRGLCKIYDDEQLKYYLKGAENLIVQEFISGTEYTIDVLCDIEGNIISIVPRQRIEVRAGEVTKSRTERNEAIIRETEKLVAKMNSMGNGIKTIGPMNIQCIVEPDGDINFIEINPRFGGGVPLSFEAGVDYGDILNRMVLGDTIAPMIGGFEEVIMLRFDDAVFIR